MSVSINGDKTCTSQFDAGDRIGPAVPPVPYSRSVGRCALLPSGDQGAFGPGVAALLDYGGKYRQTRSRQLRRCI